MEEQFEKLSLDTAEETDSSNPQSPLPKVFGNPKLLEKILSFVIFCQKEKGPRPKWIDGDLSSLNKAEIQSCRLVQNSWLQAVSDVLRLSANLDPFYKLVAFSRRDTLMHEQIDDKFKKTLTNFIKMLSSTHATQSWKHVRVNLLPFHITFHDSFLASENPQLLLDLLTNCSSGLVSLKVEFPGNLPGVPRNLPQNLQLPSLKKLNVKFTDRKCVGILEPFQAYSGENLQIKFVQSILNGAHKLMTFEFGRKSCFLPAFAYIPSSIRDLKLPPRLQSLHINLINGPTKSSDLKQLMRDNPFRNLHTISITAYENLDGRPWLNDYMEPGLMYEILAPIQSSLRNLSLLTSWHDSGFFVPYRLPKLENLTSFHIEKNWSMEPPLGTDLHSDDVELKRWDNVLPKVQTLSLLVTGSELENWTKYPQKCASVKKLTAKVYPEAEENDRDHCSLSISLTRTQVESIHATFSNLTELTTFVRGSEMSGLRSVFREMTLLKKLFISVQEWYDQDDMIHRHLGLVYWDALFVGCTVEVADMLRKDEQREQGEEMLKALQQQDHRKEFPSILNLKNLEHLSLETLDIANYADQNGGIDMESRRRNYEFPDWNLYDVSFHHAFFKMDRLTTMQIHFDAKVSASVFKEWRRLKGTNLKVEGDYHAK